jgi:hypothetical protein
MRLPCIMTYFLSILLVVTTSVVAGTSAPIRFEFVTEAPGDRLRPRQTGSVAIAGRFSRVDYREGGTDRTAVLSQDGGETEVALNDSRRTYFVPPKRLVEQIDSRLFAMPVAGPTEPRGTVKRLRWSDPPPLVAGADRGYQLLLTYTLDTKFDGSPLRVFYEAKIELWTTSRFSASYIPDDPRKLCTGNAKVDEAVRNVLSAVEGFPLQRRVTVTRTLAGGAPFSEVVTTTYQNVRTGELEPSAFHVPSGYSYEEPVWGVP